MILSALHRLVVHGRALRCKPLDYTTCSQHVCQVSFSSSPIRSRHTQPELSLGAELRARFCQIWPNLARVRPMRASFFCGRTRCPRGPGEDGADIPSVTCTKGHLRGTPRDETVARAWPIWAQPGQHLSDSGHNWPNPLQVWSKFAKLDQG